jgi:hypothetical protein
LRCDPDPMETSSVARCTVAQSEREDHQPGDAHHHILSDRADLVSLVCALLVHAWTAGTAGERNAPIPKNDATFVCVYIHVSVFISTKLIGGVTVIFDDDHFTQGLIWEVQRDHWEGSKPPRDTPRTCVDRTSDRG